MNTQKRSSLRAFGWRPHARKAATGAYSPTPVSRFYRLDWSYALKIVRISYFRLLSKLVISTPFIAPFFPILQFDKPQVFALWSASALYLVGYLLLKLRAPLFLQEYRNFKAFESCGHSHRWILWLFHEYLPVFKDPVKVLRETVDKGLSVPAAITNVNRRVYAVLPVSSELKESELKVARTYKPVNLNNDLYFVFDLHVQTKAVKYVLPMQESDPALRNRQRELYWITFGACASARKWSRRFVWFFFTAAACIFVYAGYKLVTVVFASPLHHFQIRFI